MAITLPWGAPANNGMHPTADTLLVIFDNRPGRRVMPGVRLLGFLKPKRRLAVVNGARLFLNQALAFEPRAALRIIPHGASREARRFEYGGWREAHAVSTTHPNKPMHPTADTTVFMFQQWFGAAGDWRR